MSSTTVINLAEEPANAFAEIKRRGTALLPLRQDGLARFQESGFPTTNDEDWRFTSLKPFTELPFETMFEPTIQTIGQSVINGIAFSQHDTDRLVFVDGHLSSELSQISNQSEGVIVSNLASALTTIEDKIGALSGKDQNPLIALNDAFFTDGAWIHIPANHALSKPVHLVFLYTAIKDGQASHIRNLIIAEANAKGTILESHISLGQAAASTNVVTETQLGDGSNLEHIKLQDQSSLAIHLASLHSKLGSDARYAFHSFALGAQLSRNNLRMDLAKPGIECMLNGLYMTRGRQLADHHMIVNHAAPYCNSHEYFNGILDDQSRGVFHGRILVEPEAQKTDAKQTNKNLILSDEATVNTKPQLEIYADDVKCTHGATIGELDNDAIFYLRARGLDSQTARRMLMHGFTGEIVERIQHNTIRDELNELVWGRLENEYHLN
ncbi:MAG: Fe-S cluster assembly protein SufD [Verrucomicrobiota bacterium]|nr:Fe-S cluster assembly protein SufD [Verrucomicrobiota bacterium]